MKDLSIFEPKYKTLVGYLRGYEKPPSPADILEDICERSNISIDLLKSKSRKRPIVILRQIYFRRTRERFGYSVTLRKIGSLVNRTHGDVIRGIIVANQVKEVSDKYNELYGE